MFDAHSYIEDYLNRKLDEEQKILFEESLKKDKALQKIVADYKSFVPVADHFIREDIKMLVLQERKKLNRRKMGLGILGLLVLVFLGILLTKFVQNPGQNDQFAKIYKKHYNPPMFDQERGFKDNESSDLCHRAHIQLHLANATEAKQLFEQALKEFGPTDFCYEKALYYLTLISLKENNLEVALEYNRKHIQLPPSKYAKQVQALVLDLNDLN